MPIKVSFSGSLKYFKGTESEPQRRSEKDEQLVPLCLVEISSMYWLTQLQVKPIESLLSCSWLQRALHIPIRLQQGQKCQNSLMNTWQKLCQELCLQENRLQCKLCAGVTGCFCRIGLIVQGLIYCRCDHCEKLWSTHSPHICPGSSIEQRY